MATRKPRMATTVPIAQRSGTKDEVRSALNRATRNRGRGVATASDETFLQVWNETS